MAINGRLWDSSIIGYSLSEVEEMDAEERADVLRELLNQAADLVQAIDTAFQDDLVDVDGGAVGRAGADLCWVARRIN